MKKTTLALLLILFIFAPAFSQADYRSWTRPRLGPSTGYGEPKISQNGKYAVVQKMAGPIHTGTFWFFKTKSAKPLWRYTGSKIFDLAISEKGDYIATAGSKIQLFSKKSKKPLWQNDLKTSVMDTVAITPDGKYIVTGDRFGTVFLFEKKSKNPIKTWRVFPGEFINQVVISSNGEYMAVGSNVGVAFLDRSKNKSVWKYKTKEEDGSADGVLHLSMSSSGKYFVATTSQGDNLYLFDKDTKKPKWTYYQKSFHPINASISSDGKYITLASNDKYLGFSISSNTPQWTFELDGRQAAVVQSANGKYIAIADNLDYLYLFDRAYGGSQRPFRIYEGAFPDALSLNDKGNKLIYDERDLHYQEIPPGILGDLQDQAAIYVKGQDMNLRIHATNPGTKKRMNVQVRLSLPAIAWWENIGDQVKSENDNLVSKALGKLMEGYGGDTVYDKTFTLDAQKSRTISEVIEMPGLNEPDWYDSWFLSFLSGGNILMDLLIDKVGDALEYVLPDVIANTITQGLHSMNAGGNPQFYPTIGLGKVILSDPDTGDVIDVDTFTFAFIIS